MSNGDFNPNSADAVFSRILQRLDQQDALAEKRNTEQTQFLKEIKEQCVKTNGRVTSLEKWKAVVTAKVTTVSALVSSTVAVIAWAISHFTKH